MQSGIYTTPLRVVEAADAPLPLGLRDAGRFPPS